jgi:hypothetical protein
MQAQRAPLRPHGATHGGGIAPGSIGSSIPSRGAVFGPADWPPARSFQAPQVVLPIPCAEAGFAPRLSQPET